MKAMHVNIQASTAFTYDTLNKPTKSIFVNVMTVNFIADRETCLGSVVLMLFIWVEIVRTVSSPTLIRPGTAPASIQKDDHDIKTTKKLGAYTCKPREWY